MYALAHNVSLPVPSRSRRRPRRHRAVVGSGLVAMMLASVGITAFPTTSFAAPRKLGPTVETRTGDLRSVGTSLVFVANYDASTVTAYPLTGTGSAPPVLTLSGVNVAGPQGIAIDSAGNLWVANNGSVVEYPKSQLAKSLPSPGTVIKGGGTYAGIAFDSSGDLWVDGYGNDSVDEYAKSALAKSTSSAPEVILSGGDVSRPFGLAFDRSGDLWVGSEGNNRVLEYTKAELAKSGSPTPKVDILVRVGAQELAETGATELVEEVAFDSAGNLWVARGESDSVAGYARSELSKASPVPSVIIETSGNADGLAFDRSGDLWVACYDSNAVAEYAKPQLHSSAISLVRTILASGGPAALAIEP